MSLLFNMLSRSVIVFLSRSKHLWVIHVDIWQKSNQCCKAITNQLNINKYSLKSQWDCLLIGKGVCQHGTVYGASPAQQTSWRKREFPFPAWVALHQPVLSWHSEWSWATLTEKETEAQTGLTSICQGQHLKAGSWGFAVLPSTVGGEGGLTWFSRVFSCVGYYRILSWVLCAIL